MWISSTLVAASLWALLSYNSQTLGSSFSQTVEKTSDSVCLITFKTPSSNTTVIDSEGQRKEDFETNPFDQYLKQQQQQDPDSGSGTCFIIDMNNKKYIATNEHVALDNDRKYKITFKGNIKHHNAKLIANDKLSDLAILEMLTTQGQQLIDNNPAITWGDSDTLRSGDDVYAIGHPMGMIWSVTKGIVSFNGRRLQNTWQSVIQSDVSINVGNSGGPLFNSNGEVVGVNSFIFSPIGSAGSIGINFSVSGNQAQYIFGHLIEFGKVKRSKLGLTYELDKDEGHIKVVGLDVDGPADSAGIKNGDILLKIGSNNITSQQSIGKAMDRVLPNSKLELVVERGNLILVKELLTVELETN